MDCSQLHLLGLKSIHSLNQQQQQQDCQHLQLLGLKSIHSLNHQQQQQQDCSHLFLLLLCLSPSPTLIVFLMVSSSAPSMVLLSPSLPN